jgi:hypothetical protein
VERHIDLAAVGHRIVVVVDRVNDLAVEEVVRIGPEAAAHRTPAAEDMENVPEEEEADRIVAEEDIAGHRSSLVGAAEADRIAVDRTCCFEVGADRVDRENYFEGDSRSEEDIRFAREGSRTTWRGTYRMLDDLQQKRGDDDGVEKRQIRGFVPSALSLPMTPFGGPQGTPANKRTLGSMHSLAFSIEATPRDKKHS